MVYRDRVPAHLRTVAQLTASGLKPSEPDVTAGWLEREYDGDVWRTMLYDLRSTKPLSTPAPRTAPVRTAPQAGADAGMSARTGAAAWAHSILQDQNAVVLDTELTDFAGRIIEVAVLAADGTTLLSSLVDPEGEPIKPQAERTHGISAEMLRGAPTMAQLWPRLDAVLGDKTVIAWNASFDQARLRAEHQRISPGAAQPQWLTRSFECAMRRHAEWVGEPNSRGTGFRNHKLEGGHRAEGDCRAVLERLRHMAPESRDAIGHPASTDRTRERLDVRAVRELWPQFLLEVSRRSKSTAAMVINAEPFSIADRILAVAHRSAPLALRLSDPRNLTVLSEALSAVLEPGWTVRVRYLDDAVPSPGSVSVTNTPASAVVEVEPAGTSDSEPYRDWRDTQEGLDLESWIEINPTAFCNAVRGWDGDSANDRAAAFYAVNHTRRCAADAACRTILRLADKGRFDEAKRLAEDSIGP